MLRYLTPRWPYNIQGPQTLAVAQISPTNYKQWDGGVEDSPSQMLPPPLLWPPPLQSWACWDRHPPPLWQLTLVLFLQAIVIHIYKEHFQGWKFSGGLCTNAFLQKQSCSRCLHLFPPFFWFLSFSFLSCLSFFFSFFSPRSCCLYCAYFSEYLKKPDIGDCSLIYTMFHWAGRENTHMAECAG